MEKDERATSGEPVAAAAPHSPSCDTIIAKCTSLRLAIHRECREAARFLRGTGTSAARKQ